MFVYKTKKYIVLLCLRLTASSDVSNASLRSVLTYLRILHFETMFAGKYRRGVVACMRVRSVLVIIIIMLCLQYMKAMRNYAQGVHKRNHPNAALSAGNKLQFNHHCDRNNNCSSINTVTLCFPTNNFHQKFMSKSENLPFLCLRSRYTMLSSCQL